MSNRYKMKWGPVQDILQFSAMFFWKATMPSISLDNAWKMLRFHWRSALLLLLIKTCNEISKAWRYIVLWAYLISKWAWPSWSMFLSLITHCYHRHLGTDNQATAGINYLLSYTRCRVVDMTKNVSPNNCDKTWIHITRITGAIVKVVI